MTDRLDDAQILAALEDLDGWRRDGDVLEREFRFDDFLSAIAFINRIADAAEAANHHPELRNVYSTVTVRLTSHDVGGITTRDVDLAGEIDGLAAA